MTSYDKGYNLNFDNQRWWVHDDQAAFGDGFPGSYSNLYVNDTQNALVVKWFVMHGVSAGLSAADLVIFDRSTDVRIISPGVTTITGSEVDLQVHGRVYPDDEECWEAFCPPGWTLQLRGVGSSPWSHLSVTVGGTYTPWTSSDTARLQNYINPLNP